MFDFRFSQHGILPADYNASVNNEIGSATPAELFPNPIRRGSRLQARLAHVQDAAHFEVLNFIGQFVLGWQFDLNSAGQAALPIGALLAGHYFLKITPANDDKTYTSMFVVE